MSNNMTPIKQEKKEKASNPANNESPVKKGRGGCRPCEVGSLTATSEQPPLSQAAASISSSVAAAFGTIAPAVKKKKITRNLENARITPAKKKNRVKHPPKKNPPPKQSQSRTQPKNKKANKNAKNAKKGQNDNKNLPHKNPQNMPFTAETWWMVDRHIRPRFCQGATPLVERCMRECVWDENYASASCVATSNCWKSNGGLRIGRMRRMWPRVMSDSCGNNISWIRQIMPMIAYSCVVNGWVTLPTALHTLTA